MKVIVMSLRMKFLLVMLLCLFTSGFVRAQGFEPVDLVVWARNGDTAELLSAWFDTWASENAPGSTLRVSAYDSTDLGSLLLTVNELPDMVIDSGEALAAYATAGVLIPLDGVIDTLPYDVNVLAGAQVFGSTYGIPLYSGGHLMMMANTSLRPFVQSSFEDIINSAQRLAGSEVQSLVFPIEDPRYFMSFLFGFGGAVFDVNNEFALNSATWVGTFAYIQQLASIVPAGCDAECTVRQFVNGEAAMIIADDSTLAEFMDDPNIASTLVVTPLPTLPNGIGFARPYINPEYASISVTADSAKVAAAAGFLSWLTTNPNIAINAALDLGRLPSDVSLQSDRNLRNNALLSGSQQAFNLGMVMPSDTRISCLWAALDTVLSGVVSFALTPEDAAAQAQDAAAACGARMG
jgi:arabinogalactan oligomer / maltooligosaccharide transport system substrate-binding protein